MMAIRSRYATVAGFVTFAAGCGGVSLHTQGDRQVVEWTFRSGEHVGCEVVPDELFEELRTAFDDPDAAVARDGRLGRILEYEVQAYRACEAYSNGVMDASDYRAVVMKMPPAPTPVVKPSPTIAIRVLFVGPDAGAP
jgi:hypothetical protein